MLRLGDNDRDKLSVLLIMRMSVVEKLSIKAFNNKELMGVEDSLLN
jgi:hypothetical protein